MSLHLALLWFSALPAAERAMLGADLRANPVGGGYELILSSPDLGRARLNVRSIHIGGSQVRSPLAEPRFTKSLGWVVPIRTLPKTLRATTEIKIEWKSDDGFSQTKILKCIIPSSLPEPPQEKPGQRFVLLPQSPKPQFKDAKGKPVPFENVILKALIFEGKRKSDIVFRIGKERLFIASRGSLLGDHRFEPIIEDWAAKEVFQRWRKGPIFDTTGWGPYPVTTTGGGLDPQRPLDHRMVCTGVFRLWRSRPVSMVRPGSEKFHSGGPDPTIHTAVHPLLITCRIPGQSRQDRELYAREPGRVVACEPFLILADGWQVSRELSQTSVRAELGRKFDDEVKPLIGLTARQVARIEGYPNDPKSKETLEARVAKGGRVVWRYDYVQRDAKIITFLKRRVIKVGIIDRRSR